MNSQPYDFDRSLSYLFIFKTTEMGFRYIQIMGIKLFKNNNHKNNYYFFFEEKQKIKYEDINE